MKKDIRSIQEEIKFLVAYNKQTAEKISHLKYDCQYDTEEESETLKEEEINVLDNKYEAMENLFQLESVDGEVVFACNICDEGYYTKTDVMKHLNIHHTEILQKIFEQSKKEDAHVC